MFRAIPIRVAVVLTALSVIDLSHAADSKPAGATQSQASGAEAMVASIRQGAFADPTADDNAAVKDIVPGMQVRLMTAAEALDTWKGDTSMLQMAKGLTGDHFLIALKDARGKRFHQVVSPAQVADSTRKALVDAFLRQNDVVRLLDQADQQAGDERLETLGKAVPILGAATFSSQYPEFTAELSQSKSDKLKSVRDALTTAAGAGGSSEKANRLHFELSMLLRALPPGSDDQKRIEAIDKFIDDRKLETEMKQLMVMRKYLVWASSRKYKEAIAALDEAAAVDPKSSLAGRIPAIREAVVKKMETSGKPEASESPKPMPLPTPVPGAPEPPKP